MAEKYRLLNIDADQKLDNNADADNPVTVTADYNGLQADGMTAQVLNLGDLFGTGAAAATDAVDRVQKVVAQIRLAAPDYTTGDETYNIQLQFSDTLAFTTVRAVSDVLLFASAAATPANQASTANDPIVLFANTYYQFARLRIDVSGTTPSIDLLSATLSIC